MRSLVPRAVRLAAVAVALAVAVLAWFPGGTRANAPALNGAATHPLWASSSVADFDRELDLLRDAGASTVRIGLGWSSLEEKAKGSRSQWYVDKADTFFAHARARGLRVIVTFWETPCWASSAPAEVKQDCAGPWWERGVNRYPPDPADFADAAAWVAARWGGDMAALEVWNEPNLSSFFRSSAPAADYAALLRAAYPRIKRVAPGLPVLGPSMLGSDAPFLEALYSAGIRGSYDGISIHPYNVGADPRDATPSGGRKYSFLLGVPWVRETMVAHGDGDKKLWFTELGWSSCGPGGTHAWCVTPEAQARYVADAFRVIRDCWDFVDSVSIYNLRNTGTDPNDRESQMGLLLDDFTPKASFSAFRDVLAELRAYPGAPPAAGTPACGVPADPRPADPPPAAPQPAAPRPADQRAPVSRPADPRDLVAPTVRGLALRPTRLRRGRSARIAWSLSESARVSFRVESLRGRRARWVRLTGSFRRSGAVGANRMRFAGRLRGRLLAPGRYRVVALARDGAGNVSSPARAAFRIVR